VRQEAFLNFDHRLLSDGLHLSLPRQATVIEILETVDPTADLIALCSSIHDQGYTIALDDFFDSPQFEPLTRLAQLIKLDMRLTGKREQERLLRTYRPRGIALGREGGDLREIRLGARSEIQSIEQALMIVGTEDIRRWAELPPCRCWRRTSRVSWQSSPSCGRGSASA
jgi:c-di-GMP-related signal transduction protein